MSVLAALSRRWQTLTTDSKPDPPRVQTQSPDSDLSSHEVKPKSLTTDAKPDPPRVHIQSPDSDSCLQPQEIKQKSAPVTPEPNRMVANLPAIRRQSSESSPSPKKQTEFSNADNLGFSGTSKPEPRPRSPRAKTKPKYKPSPSPTVVNYNIVNSHSIMIGSKNSYTCNINQYTGNANTTSEGVKKPKEKPMPKDVEELSTSKEIISLDDMFLIKTHIGYGWRDVARRLGYSEGQIQQFEADHKYTDQVVYQILHDWKQSTAKDAQLGVLISHIWQSQEYDCAERLATSYKNST